MATSDDTEKNAPLADVSDSEITSLVDDVLKSGKQVPVMPLAETTAEAERMHARVIATQMKRLAEQLESPSNAPAQEEKDEWWFEVSGQRLGPLSLQKIRFLWEDGELTPDSLCWREGLSAWVPLFKISDLAHALSPKGQPVHQKVKEVTANLRQPAPAAAPTGWRPTAGAELERSARERLEAGQRREPEALEAPVEREDESARSFQSLPAVPLPVAAPEEPKRSGTNVSGSIISGLVAGLVVVAAIVGMRWLPMLRPAPVIVNVPAAAPPTPPTQAVVAAPAAPAAPAVPAAPPPAAAPVAPPAVVAAPATHATPAQKAVATPASSEEHPKPPTLPSASAKSPAARGKPLTVEDSFAQEFSASGGTPLSLSSSQIMEVVAKHRSEVSHCVQAQHAQVPDSSGRLVMRWSVHLDGHVSDVSVKSEDLADSPLAQCLSKIIPSWTFPEHEVEHPPVEMPFPF